MDRGAWWASLWGHKGSDRTEQLSNWAHTCIRLLMARSSLKQSHYLQWNRSERQDPGRAAYCFQQLFPVSILSWGRHVRWEPRRRISKACSWETEVQNCIRYSLPVPSCGEGKWHPTPVLLPGKSHGQRSLVGCSPWGREESDTLEWLHFHFSLSCIGEGNGNMLQCSCLENPREGGAWWAAVYRVTQSRTRLKWLSSSSSSSSSAQLCLPLCDPWCLDGKESACSVETQVQSLGWEDPLEKGKVTHYSVLAWNSMDRGSWWAAVHGVIKSQTRLSD